MTIPLRFLGFLTYYSYVVRNPLTDSEIGIKVLTTNRRECGQLAMVHGRIGGHRHIMSMGVVRCANVRRTIGMRASGPASVIAGYKLSVQISLPAIFHRRPPILSFRAKALSTSK